MGTKDQQRQQPLQEQIQLLQLESVQGIARGVGLLVEGEREALAEKEEKLERLMAFMGSCPGFEMRDVYDIKSIPFRSLRLSWAAVVG